jgi:hypothetical protein
MSAVNQHGKPRKCTYLFTEPAFRLGFQSGMRGIFEPEVFFHTEWEQTNYERGFHFSRVLRTKHQALNSLPKRPTPSLKAFLNEAVRNKEII